MAHVVDRVREVGAVHGRSPSDGGLGQFFEQERHDRHAAARPLPRAADALVVDEAHGVGGTPEHLGVGGRGQRRRFEIGLVDGEALEPVPQRRQGPPFVAERERRRVGAGGELAGDFVPHVVRANAHRRPVSGDGVEAPFDGGLARPGVGEPGLGAVHVAVDGRAEAGVDRLDELGRYPPDGGGDSHAALTTSAGSSGP